MKSLTTQTIFGLISSTGVVIRGEMICQKGATGFYTLHAPPGRKLLGLVACLTNGVAWGFIGVDQDTDSSCRIVIANTAGSVNIDNQFRYIALLSA